jgi:hypothetical protein
VYRWEWNRAIVVGVMFVAVEVATALALIFRRLNQLEQKVAKQPDPQVLAQLKKLSKTLFTLAQSHLRRVIHHVLFF